ADVAALALLHRQMAELVVRWCTTFAASHGDAAINSCADAANSRCYATCWSRSIYRLAHGAREDVSRSAPTRTEGRCVDRGGYRELDAQPTVVVILPLASHSQSTTRWGILSVMGLHRGYIRTGSPLSCSTRGDLTDQHHVSAFDSGVLELDAG